MCDVMMFIDILVKAYYTFLCLCVSQMWKWWKWIACSSHIVWKGDFTALLIQHTHTHKLPTAYFEARVLDKWQMLRIRPTRPTNHLTNQSANIAINPPIHRQNVQIFGVCARMCVCVRVCARGTHACNMEYNTYTHTWAFVLHPTSFDNEKWDIDLT